MITHLQLCWKHACRVKRYRRITFQPGFNLLIGPNGTGKSTLIEALTARRECRRVESGVTAIVHFSTQRMDPSRTDHRVLRYQDMVLETRAKFSSHGQLMQAAFASLVVTLETCLILDEPESGQDFDSRLQEIQAANDGQVAYREVSLTASMGDIFPCLGQPVLTRDVALGQFDAKSKDIQRRHVSALLKRKPAFGIEPAGQLDLHQVLSLARTDGEAG